MSGVHEPRDEFVNQLELLVRADLKRRPAATGTYGWMPTSRAAAALVVVAIAIVSMAMGGGVVAATYEARIGQQRELLLGTFEQRAVIAKQRLALATEQLRSVRQRVSVGIEPGESVQDAQFKVSEAEAELKSIELDIAEIRAAGREPLNTLSAPLVAGRDFVMERLRVEMSIPAAALEVERSRVQAARTRFEVGLGKPHDVGAAETRVIELESAVKVIELKIGIRETFLKGGLQAKVADLRGLEAEFDLGRTALASRIEFARRQVDALKRRVGVGTANALDLAEAQLRLQELQLEGSKADYELLLIRLQLRR